MNYITQYAYHQSRSKAEPLSALMRKTRFKKRIRIDEKQLEWLRENKDCRTMAGFLDKIINQHKKNH